MQHQQQQGVSQSQSQSQYGPRPHQPPPTEMPHPQMLGIQLTQEQLQHHQALPITTRPPTVSPVSPGSAPPGTTPLDEIAATVGVGNYVDDMEQPTPGGEETERGGVMGNRWPRQETLALLKIRSDMDAAFRDATLKGPLWDKVSSMMSEEGYTRSSKKCKEKFENVHKYYKRTRKNCAGTQDGKSYRFFSQLEALQNSTMSSPISAPPPALPPLQSNQPLVPGLQNQPPSEIQQLQPQGARKGIGIGIGAGEGAASSLFSFSSNTSSSTSLSGSDGEDTAEEATDEGGGSKKRKRCGKSESAGKKMRSFFKGLMQQVLERQENMQRKFLETVEKREQERIAREEAWRRQEMARLNRDHDLLAQERAIAASRDSCIITFLQKITGESIQLPQMPPVNVNVTPPPPYANVTLPPSSSQQTPQSLQHVQRHRGETTPRRPPPPVTSSEANTPSRETTATTDSASSSRWPKAEVLALIKVRSEMEPRYQESGPKGPLWEDISSSMLKMGYNRSSKRCKEKWENINKYFKKVKESSKKRPEDSKTCPYFHQLDALYRKKIIGGGGTSGGNGQQTGQIDTSTEPINPDILPITTLPPAAPTQETMLAHSRGASESCGVSESMVQQLNTSNGNHPQPQCFSEGGGPSADDDVTKKPEDTVKLEMMKNYENPEENDSEGMTIGDEDNDDDEEDEEDEEKQKTEYKMELQRPNISGGGGGGNSSNNNGSTTATGTATTAGSFLAMVK